MLVKLSKGGKKVKLSDLRRKSIDKFLQKNITAPQSDKELKEIFNNKLKSSQKLKVKDGYVKVKKKK